MLKQKFIVQFGSSFLIKILGMLAGLIVARLAGPEVVGVIAFGTAYVSIWGFTTGLFSTGHIKLISEGKNLGNCITTYTFLQGSSILVYSILVISWFLSQKYLFNYQFESDIQQIVILIMLFVQVFVSILNFNNVTFTAKLEQAKANLPLFFQGIMYHLGRIVIVIIGLKAIALVSWNLITTIIAIPLAWHFYKQLPFGKFDRELIKEYFHYVPPIALVVIINSLLGYSDKLLLSHYTSVKELGYYTAAFSIGGMFMLVSRAAGQIFFPLFSNLIAKKDWKTVNQKIQAFQDFVSIFMFPAICAIIILADFFLILILGNQYEPSILPFKILLLATYISIVGLPYGNIIAGMGHFYTNALINGLQLIIFLISIVFFVSPKFLNLGATGLALTLLIKNIFGNLLFLVYAKNKGEITFNFRSIVRVLIALIIAGMTIYTLYILGPSPLYQILGSASYLILIYLIFHFTKQMNKNHVATLLELTKVQSIFQYIKDEIKSK